MAGVMGADPDRLGRAAEQLATLAQQVAAVEARLGRLAGLAGAHAAPAEAYARVPALVSELSVVATAAHHDALLLKDRALNQRRKSKPSHPPPLTGTPVAPTKSAQYRIGPPTAPTIPHHNHFPYDPSQKPTASDYLNRKKWIAYMYGAMAARSDLEDGTKAYYHYWFGNGKPLTVNYEKAHKEDAVIRRWVDYELQAARWAAEDLHLRSGRTSFQMTGERVDITENPATENWQKTLGKHHLWVTADVRVDGDTVTATATVHAKDWYNFNPGGKDIATGWPDDSNGRFATIGWAKEFETHGELQRVMTWTMSAPDKAHVAPLTPHPPIPTPAPTPVPTSGASGGRRW